MPIAFVKINQIRQFGEKFQMSLLNTKEFLKWVLKTKFSSPQHVVAVMRTKKKSKRAQNFAAILAVTIHSLVLEVRARKIRQALRPSTAAQTYAASDGRVAP